MNRSTLLLLAGCYLFAQSQAGLRALGSPQDDNPRNEKIDTGLDQENRRYAIFVRMRNQILPDGKAYKEFCKKHTNDKRRKLRKWVLATLRKKSDKSWKKVEPRVTALEKDNAIQDRLRYWIVNGFACTATGKAVKELAALDSVAFVYRQRLTPQHKRSARGRGRRLRGRPIRSRAEQQKQVMERVLRDWRDDSDDPLKIDELTIPWNVERIGAVDAWKNEQATGKNVVIGLIDSGLLVTPSLMQALWRNKGEKLNGKDDDGNGYVDDIFGYDFQADSFYCLGDRGISHGSICAGIMVGRPGGDNKLITGIAPRARVMVLRGMGMLKTYEYALMMGADIISMSYMWVNRPLGHYRGLFRTAHEHLTIGGIVSVGGAGNFAGNGPRAAPKGKQIATPKDIPCVIAASGLMKNGNKAPASSEGPCTWDDVKFFTDFPKWAPLMKPDVTGFFGGYPTWTRTGLRRGWRTVWQGENRIGLVVGPRGNSFSGPHAGGVVALMLSANPDLPAWRVKEVLEASCKDIGKKGRDTIFGAGLMQAQEAVKAVKALRVRPRAKKRSG